MCVRTLNRLNVQLILDFKTNPIYFNKNLLISSFKSKVELIRIDTLRAMLIFKGF